MLKHSSGNAPHFVILLSELAINPNPLHSLWEEIGVSGGYPRLSVERGIAWNDSLYKYRVLTIQKVVFTAHIIHPLEY
jgi:hypothetical protein